METSRRPPPVLDMTPDGGFRDPPQPGPFDRLLLRVGGAAALVVVGVGALGLAALALVVLGFLIPVLIGAGAVAFGSLWWRARRAQRPAPPANRSGVQGTQSPGGGV